MKNLKYTSAKLPRHGGNLEHAVEQYGGAYEDWTDLSTGISPWVYPIPEISNDVWRELPKPSVSLERVAATYYNTTPKRICVTPGSQLAIRILPSLIEKQTIAIPLIGYQEHRHAWEKAGHSVVFYENEAQLLTFSSKGLITSAVVINPNNPSNEFIAKEILLELANTLNGLLIIDEAFADFDKSQSLSANTDIDNLIIIRSIGKFFGLAGARIGFLIGSHEVLQQLKALFTPWSINAPAQTIAEIALQDTQWQTAQIKRIQQHSSELETVLTAFIDHQKLDLECRSNGLFTSLFGRHPLIKNLHHMLAEKRFWTRIGDPFMQSASNDEEQYNWLRLSLPDDSLNRLKHTLLSINSIPL